MKPGNLKYYPKIHLFRNTKSFLNIYLFERESMSGVRGRGTGRPPAEQGVLCWD